MHLKQTIGGTLLLFILAGCSSSPPEPVKLKWDTPTTPLNERLPLWENNHVIVPAQHVTGLWSFAIPNFNIHHVQSIETYYAIVHSTRITIKAVTNEQYTHIKNYLIHQGASGIINFELKEHCLLCNSATVYFYREQSMN